MRHVATEVDFARRAIAGGERTSAAALRSTRPSRATSRAVAPRKHGRTTLGGVPEEVEPWRCGACTWSWRTGPAGWASWPPRSGAAGCNIISLHVVGEPADDGSVTDELLVKVPDRVDPAAPGRRGRPRPASRARCWCAADATELSDPATTALALARMVAADPGSAPRAVATMLRARLVDPAATRRRRATSHTLRVGAQQLRLGRAWPFTATELSRAAALLELAAQLAMRARGPRRRRRPDPAAARRLGGADARRRPVGRAAGGRAARALLPAVPPLPVPQPDPAPARRRARRAARLAAGPGQAVLAVTADGGSAVGVANLDRERDGPAAAASPCWWRTPGRAAGWAPRCCAGSPTRPPSRACVELTGDRPPGRPGRHPAAAPGRAAPVGRDRGRRPSACAPRSRPPSPDPRSPRRPPRTSGKPLSGRIVRTGFLHAVRAQAVPGHQRRCARRCRRRTCAGGPGAGPGAGRRPWPAGVRPSTRAMTGRRSPPTSVLP